MAALCSNNAKSCYDRIMLLAEALCLCRFGSTLPMVASMITTLHKMEHHIQTKFRDSAICALRTTWQWPMVGISQGNGAGPHIVAAISSPIFDIMWADGFYAQLMLAICSARKKGRICIHRWNGFVHLSTTQHGHCSAKTDAKSGQPLGRTPESHQRSISAHQVFLVPNGLPDEEWQMELHNKHTTTRGNHHQRWPPMPSSNTMVRSTQSMPDAWSTTCTRQKLGNRSQLLTLGHSRLESQNGGIQTQPYRHDI